MNLENCNAVTDVGIMAIADGCTNLKNLKINRCKKVTNKGMIALSDNCRKLEELDVWHCPKLTDIRVEKLIDKFYVQKGYIELRKLTFKSSVGLDLHQFSK